MRYTKLVLALLTLAGPCFAAAEPLTIERIFAGPDLSGPRLQQPQLSPDGRYVTYLQGKPDNKDQLDLWAFDTRTGAARLLVDSRALLGGEEQLSAEEEARRERQRTASLRGIVEYHFSNDGRRLLIPLGGELYVYDLRSRANPVRQLTHSNAHETDARFSPKASFVSFVRDQDLFVIDLATGRERAITDDGEGSVHNGVAEFIAQEEMGRDTGYWWSPDERRIAYTRVDESSVQQVERIEVHAEGARVLRQRYPAAGTENAKVELKVVEIDTGYIASVDLGAADTYLARVAWFPDSQHVAVQRQSRDQKRLDLLKAQADTGDTRPLFSETSRSWVELHDDLRFLERQAAFIWASRRSGFNHLYLYDLEGHLIRPLTSGSWMVAGDGVENGLVGIDERKRLVYFLANEASPLERHLYSQSLDTDDPGKVRRISREPGWHDARLMPNALGYLDLWSSPEQPPSASLRKLDGAVQRWIVRNELDAKHPYHPYSSSHVAEEFGSIRAEDGQPLYYRVLKPRQLAPGRRYPVVVDTYGGPHFQYVRKDWMGGSRAAQGYFRQVLAQHGFVVFTLDNRGSGFRGVAFESALHRQFGKVEVEDQLAGVAFIRRQSYVDPERIGIMGWSYGGYMALMALTHSDAFKAGVAGAPVTDWSLYDTHYTERYLGTPASNADGYERSAVLPHADALHGRLLLVHGMADDNVLFTHSTMLMERLQTLGKPFELMTYPGGKHGLIRMPQTGKHYYRTVLEFFEKQLAASH